MLDGTDVEGDSGGVPLAAVQLADCASSLCRPEAVRFVETEMPRLVIATALLFALRLRHVDVAHVAICWLEVRDVITRGLWQEEASRVKHRIREVFFKLQSQLDLVALKQPRIFHVYAKCDRF